jgi:nucleoid-associated protein YgaU
MRNDLKTGMLIGVVLVIGAILIMSVWPNATIESRLRRSRTYQLDEPSGETVPIDKDQFEGPLVEPDRHNEPAPPIEQASEPTDVEFKEIREAPIESPEAELTEELKFHIVSGGETLSAISVMYYGNTYEWRKIVNANPNEITDENRVRPGMRLIIPK